MPGPFFTRPNFEDRQIVQYSGSSITLSGNTNIYPTGNFRIYKNAFPGLVATSLDADGTVGWGPISGISWSVSACTSPLYVNNLVSCPSSGGTIQVDAGNLALNSELNFLITLSAGTTTDNVLVIDSGGYVKSIPQASITPIFTGGTGNCVTDLYVTNIHGCSPIYIQPVSPDDVYLVNGGGNVGINVLTATTKLHVSGNTLFNADVLWLSTNNTTIVPTPTFKGVVVDQYFDAGGALVLAGIFTQNTSPSGNTGILMSNDTGVGGYISVPGSLDYRTGSPVTGEEFYRNKMVIKALSPSEGMVFNPSSGNADSTFWWEMDGRSLMVLKGDGIDKGFLGLALNIDGTEMPTANLQIGGTGTTGTFQYRDGNQASGYVLTSDSDGNATWQPSAGGTFTGNTSGDCITDLYVTNIHGCSPINIQPTSPDDVYMVMGGGNLGIGTLNPLVKLHVSGDSFTSGELHIVSDLPITQSNIDTFKNQNRGVSVLFNYTGNTVSQIINLNPSGNSYVFIANAPTNTNYLRMAVGGPDYLRDAIAPVVGFDFWRNKAEIMVGDGLDGISFDISPSGNNGRLWFMQNANAPMGIFGGGSPSDLRLGIALNPDGTEIPTASLQIGGTGTTGTFKYRDGNQASGYVLTSDSGGTATWQPSAGGTFTGNTSATCITDLWVTNVYGCSPITVHDDIVFVTNKAITTNNGGGQIDLDFGGVADKVIITNDNGAFGKETLWMENGFLALYAGSTDMLIELDNASAEKGVEIRTQIANSYVRLGAGPVAADTILIYDSPIANVISSVYNKPAVLIGTRSSTVLSGVTNSVIMGGIGITATTNNTVYVPDLVIKKSANAPTTSGDTVGGVGSVTWDNNYFYVKTNTGWGRVSLDYGF